MRIIFASRKSSLARRQTEWVMAAIRAGHPGLKTGVLALSTRGDELLDRSLAVLGGKGLFIKTLEEALADGRARLAVNSLKDMPTQLEPGFRLAAVPVRADPRDSLVSHYPGGLLGLPAGARIGSASLRRRAQVLALRPDCRVDVLRGGVGTRLERFDAGEFDAILLAAAGLERLGIARGEPIDPDQLLPAPGQGALALEARADDAEVLALAATIEDPLTRDAIRAERSCCRVLGAGCTSPVAAYATVTAGRIRLRALVAREDGRRVIRAERYGGRAMGAELGAAVAGELLERGAAELLNLHAGTA